MNRSIILFLYLILATSISSANVTTFNETGEQVIEGMIYEHNSVCWQFTKTFITYNPTWSNLLLGSGENFFNPHSVAYLRRDNTSAYVHDAWGGDTFIAEFDKNGSVTFWTHLEDGMKVFETRNKEFLLQFDHFNFSPVGHMTRRAISQDNRMKFINGEI